MTSNNILDVWLRWYSRGWAITTLRDRSLHRGRERQWVLKSLLKLPRTHTCSLCLHPSHSGLTVGQRETIRSRPRTLMQFTKLMWMKLPSCAKRQVLGTSGLSVQAIRHILLERACPSDLYRSKGTIPKNYWRLPGMARECTGTKKIRRKGEQTPRKPCHQRGSLKPLCSMTCLKRHKSLGDPLPMRQYFTG